MRSETASSSSKKVSGAALLIGLVLVSTPVSCRSEQARPVRLRPPVRMSPPVAIVSLDAPASAQNAAFSPDGKTVLFTLFHRGYNEGPAGLYAVPRTGGAPVRVLDEPDRDSVNQPGSTWNGPTGRIVFASDRQDVDEIWTAEPDGTKLSRVTRHTSPTRFIEPSFSPDGAWIAFEVDSGTTTDDEQRGSIWKVRASGGRPRRLIETPGTDDRLPNWSPASGRVVFQRRRIGSDDWNLYTMTPDGLDVQQVTVSPSSDTDPSFSPDGRWIAYSSDHGDIPAPNIFVISSKGGEPIRVTASAVQEHAAPSWSGDGKWIAYESHVVGDDETPASLWLVQAPRI